MAANVRTHEKYCLVTVVLPQKSRSMAKLLCYLLASIFVISASAQSIAPTDIGNYEEDVYFILSGEADKAISEGDYQTAVKRINEAIEHDPDNPTNVLLLSNLGILYNYLDQDSLALEALDRANLMAPSMTVVLVNRAKLRLKMGDDKEAYEDFGKVIARDSTNTEVLFYHGMMALYSGKQKEAQSDFRVLENIAPKGRETAIALSSLYSMTGRDAEAIPYLQELVEIDPQPEYYANLASCYIMIDHLSEASALLSEAMGKFPDDPELYLYRALLNKKRYLLKEAKEDAAKAVSLGADPRKVGQMMQKD